MTPDVHIRPAAGPDIPVLVALTVRMYDEHIADGLPFFFVSDPEAMRAVLATQLTSKLCLTLVAEAQGGIAGFISVVLKKPDRRFTMDGRLGRVSDIYVEPAMRTRGIAGALLEAAEAWMRENGATLAECDIVSGNKRGAAFWRGRGYGEMASIHYKEL